MKNLKIVEKEVKVHYNDMEGLLSFDWRVPGVMSICKDHGIDVEKNFLLGFGFGFGEMHGDDALETVRCRVLLLDERYGSSYDEVERNIKGVASLNVISKHFSIPFQELGKYIKTLELMAVGEISKHINSLEIVRG